MTSFERVKTGVRDLAYTKLVNQQLRDGIRLPPSHVLDFVMGLSSDRSKVTGKTLTPILQEVSVVLESEMAPDLRTDQLIIDWAHVCHVHSRQHQRTKTKSKGGKRSRWRRGTSGIWRRRGRLRSSRIVTEASYSCEERRPNSDDSPKKLTTLGWRLI